MLKYTTREPLENAPSQLFFTEATVYRTHNIKEVWLEMNSPANPLGLPSLNPI